jgi:two-component system phosphate regulon sensor histidine kinase PhoR
VNAAPVRDRAGEAAGMVVAIHDVTPLYEWEQARQGFVAMAAHELRSPATGILLAAQVLQRRLARLPATERVATSQALATLQRQTRRLNGLIQDLLDSVRLEGGLLVMEISTFDLVALARRVVADSTADPGQVTVTPTDTALLVAADPARVEQIVVNLLDNARKYSPPGATVQVKITADATAVTLSVIDEGIGIPAEELPRLFEPYYRASNVASHTGLGLGLALSRELARRMGGDVTATSAEGRGSTVTLRLPRA